VQHQAQLLVLDQWEKAIRAVVRPLYDHRVCVSPDLGFHEGGPLAHDLARHRKTFRAYGAAYPLVWAVTRLDALVPAPGYMLIASLRRSAS